MYSKPSLHFLLLALATMALSALPVARADTVGSAPHLLALEVLTVRLALTEDQAAEVEPVLQQHHLAQQAVFEQHDIDPQAGRAAPRPSRRELFELAGDLMPIWEQANAAMAAILTDEQMREWLAYQNERRNQLQRRLRGRR
jgi:hypothetical protein